MISSDLQLITIIIGNVPKANLGSYNQIVNIKRSYTEFIIGTCLDVFLTPKI